MTRIAMFAATALMPLALCAQETIILRDGTQFTGSMTSATSNTVLFRDDRGVSHRFDINQIDSLQFSNGGYNSRSNNNYPNNNNYPTNNGNFGNAPDNRAYPQNGQFGNSDPSGRGYNNQGSRRSMTLPAGSEISVRTNENIDSASSNDNRFYTAVVSRDVVDDRGSVVIPRGSDAQLIVRRLSGNNLALDLQSVSVNGQRFNVDTANVTAQGTSRDGLGENKRTAEYAGGGALLGTLLGAIAGGGKGAAIGALAGGAAGVGAQVLTRGGQVKVPAESELSFRLDSPMTLRY